MSSGIRSLRGWCDRNHCCVRPALDGTISHRDGAALRSMLTVGCRAQVYAAFGGGGAAPVGACLRGGCRGAEGDRRGRRAPAASPHADRPGAAGVGGGAERPRGPAPCIGPPPQGAEVANDRHALHALCLHYAWMPCHVLSSTLVLCGSRPPPAGTILYADPRTHDPMLSPT